MFLYGVEESSFPLIPLSFLQDHHPSFTPWILYLYVTILFLPVDDDILIFIS